METQTLSAARRLVQRYGVVTREIAALNESLPPWRVLYEVLSRLELADEVRRGYFVEGMSGAQFADPEAARMLQELTLPSTVQSPLILLHSQDPANLHGSSAPFEIPGLGEEKIAFVRRPGNWLVLQAGKPLLLIEQHGKRLTSVPGARDENLAAAVRLLPAILGKQNKMMVEEWNGESATAAVPRALLEAAGFVRDYQTMTLYASFRS